MAMDVSGGRGGWGAEPLTGNENGTSGLRVAARVGCWSVSDGSGSAEALETVELMVELGEPVTTVDANDDAAPHGGSCAARGNSALRTGKRRGS